MIKVNNRSKHIKSFRNLNLKLKNNFYKNYFHKIKHIMLFVLLDYNAKFYKKLLIDRKKTLRLLKIIFHKKTNYKKPN